MDQVVGQFDIQSMLEDDQIEEVMRLDRKYKHMRCFLLKHDKLTNSMRLHPLIEHFAESLETLKIKCFENPPKIKDKTLSIKPIKFPNLTKLAFNYSNLAPAESSNNCIQRVPEINSTLFAGRCHRNF